MPNQISGIPTYCFPVVSHALWCAISANSGTLLRYFISRKSQNVELFLACHQSSSAPIPSDSLGSPEEVVVGHSPLSSPFSISTLWNLLATPSKFIILQIFVETRFLVFQDLRRALRSDELLSCDRVLRAFIIDALLRFAREGASATSSRKSNSKVWLGSVLQSVSQCVCRPFDAHRLAVNEWFAAFCGEDDSVG